MEEPSTHVTSTGEEPFEDIPYLETHGEVGKGYVQHYPSTPSAVPALQAENYLKPELEMEQAHEPRVDGKKKKRKKKAGKDSSRGESSFFDTRRLLKEDGIKNIPNVENMLLEDLVKLYLDKYPEHIESEAISNVESNTEAQLWYQDNFPDKTNDESELFRLAFNVIRMTKKDAMKPKDDDDDDMVFTKNERIEGREIINMTNRKIHTGGEDTMYLTTEVPLYVQEGIVAALKKSNIAYPITVANPHEDTCEIYNRLYRVNQQIKSGNGKMTEASSFSMFLSNMNTFAAMGWIPLTLGGKLTKPVLVDKYTAEILSGWELVIKMLPCDVGRDDGLESMYALTVYPYEFDGNNQPPPKSEWVPKFLAKKARVAEITKELETNYENFMRTVRERGKRSFDKHREMNERRKVDASAVDTNVYFEHDQNPDDMIVQVDKREMIEEFEAFTANDITFLTQSMDTGALDENDRDYFRGLKKRLADSKDYADVIDARREVALIRIWANPYIVELEGVQIERFMQVMAGSIPVNDLILIASDEVKVEDIIQSREIHWIHTGEDLDEIQDIVDAEVSKLYSEGADTKDKVLVDPVTNPDIREDLANTDNPLGVAANVHQGPAASQQLLIAMRGVDDTEDGMEFDDAMTSVYSGLGLISEPSKIGSKPETD